jgi:hypothetical protein
MLESRRIAGRTLYRVVGTVIWSYSRMDALERAKLESAKKEVVNPPGVLTLHRIA